MDRGDANWTEVAKGSVLRGLESVKQLRHLSPRSQLLLRVKVLTTCGTIGLNISLMHSMY